MGDAILELQLTNKIVIIVSSLVLSYTSNNLFAQDLFSLSRNLLPSASYSSTNGIITPHLFLTESPTPLAEIEIPLTYLKTLGVAESVIADMENTHVNNINASEKNMLDTLDFSVFTEEQQRHFVQTILFAPEAILTHTGAYFNPNANSIDWEVDGQIYRWRDNMSNSPDEAGTYGEARVTEIAGDSDKCFEIIFEVSLEANHPQIIGNEELKTEYPDVYRNMMTFFEEVFPTVCNDIDHIYFHATSGRRVEGLSPQLSDVAASTSVSYKIIGTNLYIESDISMFNPELEINWVERNLLNFVRVMDIIEFDLRQPRANMTQIGGGIGGADILLDFYSYIADQLPPDSEYNQWGDFPFQVYPFTD